MGVIPPDKGFLAGLRLMTEQNRSLLIFDEIMTGFRVHPGGAQTLYGIEPDLTTLGKVIGGGLPVGAYGGKREIMRMIAPSGPVYQAGTLSGNPLAMAAGIATLKAIQPKEVWRTLEEATLSLVNGIADAAKANGISVWQNRVGTMFATFFTEEPVHDWTSAKSSDTVRFGGYFRQMLENGIYLAPSQFEAGFMSMMHTKNEIDATISAADDAFRMI